MLRFGLCDGGEEHGLGDVRPRLDPDAASLILRGPLGVLLSLALALETPKYLLVDIDDTVTRIKALP